MSSSQEIVQVPENCARRRKASGRMFAEGKGCFVGGILQLREPDELSSGGVAVRAVGALLHAFYAAVRLPVLTLLVVLEPLVRVFLAGVALLFVLVAVFLELSAPRALHVPFCGLLATGIGCAWILALYYWILRILSA
jgi:hypothetical protein